MEAEKEENIGAQAFKQDKNRKFALRKLLTKYGFGLKLSQETHSRLKFRYFVDFCARILMEAEKVENIAAQTFKQDKN